MSDKPDILELLSQPLYKMAIKDLEPGEPEDNEHGETSWDYSHLLPPKSGLQLFVTPGEDMIYTHVQDPEGNHVGNVKAFQSADTKGNVHIEPHSDLHEDYHGQGIGKAMYEALYAHAYHKMGIRHVSGGFHSEDAGRVHEALARKHGLEYKAARLPALSERESGMSRGQYNYALGPKVKKSEDGFLNVSPEVFESAIAKHPDQSNLENPRDYEGKKTFLAHDQSHGYALHGDELTNVFSLAPGGGSKAVRHAIQNGARRLSAFDGHLPAFYSKFGFKEARREPNWTPGGPDVVYMELPGMAKGLLGAALAAGVMAAAPDYRLVNAFNRAQTVPQYARADAPAKWSPVGLHQDLIPIAHLESSFGLNMLHAPNSKGDYQTAYGALGFKPSTAHEEWQKTKALQKAYPGLESPEAFMKKFKTDHQFYNTVASSHFLRLKQRHGTPTKAAYAWRWGSGAASKADDKTIANDDYVKKYHNLALQTGVKPSIVPTVKSESLDKMAIKEIAPGKPDEKGHFDYSHLLPYEFKNKLQLKVIPGPEGWIHSSLYETPGTPPIGTASGYIHPNAIEPHSDLDMNFRGKGLGQAMYEALYSHAYHHLGLENVHGGAHTEAAGRVHEALARKHGMSYSPRIETDPVTGRSARHPYNYAIKSEEELHRAAPKQNENEVAKSEHYPERLNEVLAESDDLRKPKYRGNPNPHAGHCYVASEALWHLMGGPDSGYVPQNIQHEGDQHWYLKHKTTGDIIDPTAQQFKTPVPYENGRGKGFLTKEPSKRAAELMERLKAKHILSPVSTK